MKDIKVGVTVPEQQEVTYVTVPDSDDTSLIAAIVKKKYGYIVYVIAGAEEEHDDAVELAAQYFMERQERVPKVKETLQ